jgi:hypothetical protein
MKIMAQLSACACLPVKRTSPVRVSEKGCVEWRVCEYRAA